jgi:carboxypeptidase Q
MTKQRLVSLLVLLLVLASCAAPAATTAQEAQVAYATSLDELLAVSAHDNRVQQHVETLTLEIGPRLTTSSNLMRAEEWARAEFERWGLTAWIESYDEWPVGFDRGPSSGKMVAPEELELEFQTMAWTPGTDGPTRLMVVAEPKTLDELEAARGQFAGALLLANRRDERAPKEVREAAELVYTEAGLAGRVRSGSKGGRIVMSGRAPKSVEEIATELSVTLLAEQYDKVAGLLAEDGAVEFELDVQNHFRVEARPLRNVVAELEGSEFPDEYVIVQGHLDSWDGAEGACDNATGVATTMEAARLLAELGTRPRRSIRFVLYSGEEQGLFGSRAYVRDHADELERISVVLNHDGGTNYLSGIQATAPMLADFESVFAALDGLDAERPFEIKEVEGLRPGPSDHAPFVQAGVPAFFWGQSFEGYNHVHHTQHDHFEMVKADDQAHSARVVAVAAFGFANLDNKLDRTDLRMPENRKMGVQLDGTSIAQVVAGGKAEQAQWQAGDEIVSIDGVEVSSRRDVTRELQAGGARKVFVMKRGEETLETVLDYSDDPQEERRARLREKRERKRELEEAKES